MDGNLIATGRQICLGFPDTEEHSLTGQHTAFSVRGKKFAYFLIDHHGDGRLALHFRAPLGAQEALIDRDPARYFRPPYIGHRGWVGLDLGVDEVDWEKVGDHLEAAYRMTAPKRLAAQLG